MDQPKWLDEAWRELGQHEGPGAHDNPRILALYRDAGHGEVTHDETAWCAAFAGACLVRAGYAGSGSLMARSYLSFGEAANESRTGAIAVLSRGGDPSLGHTGFLIGETDDAVILLGGNQGDAVSVAAFPRSRLLGLRWPGNAGEAASTAASAQADEDRAFEHALAHVLEMEGGYTDDPYDPGGPTNKGITLRVFAEWKHVTVDAVSFAALKSELKVIPDAMVSGIYRERYWQPAQCERLPPSLALMHFDAGVNHGTGGAARMLQEALGVDVDGDIGPGTLSAVARSEPVALIERYAGLRRARYRALPHFWRFGRGWLARVDQTLIAAKSLQTAKLFPSEKGHATMTTSVTPVPPVMVPAAAPKWWGESMTIWGAVLTALASVLPALASIGGISLTPDLIQEAGAHVAAAVQAFVALAGTMVTIYGRVQARQPLERRVMNLKL
ncbi:MAG: TIGR02594 family protein [Hyphomicrobium sp.]